jgi:hypothetical protein
MFAINLSPPVNMNSDKRPLSLTVLACVYILVGVAGFVFHFKEAVPLNRDGALVELTELLAVVAGVFLLRRQNWARWLALAWMAFHVIISAFHPLGVLLVHSGMLIVIGWIVLRPAATRYFRRTESATS